MTRSKSTAVAEPVRVTEGEIALVPFQPQWINLAWEWLNEFPDANFDDYGVKTIEQFAGQLLERIRNGQVIIGVLNHGQPVGIIGFQPVTQRMGHFDGICFSKEVHGKGVAFHAMQLMLKTLWLEGYQKIEARFFDDNRRIAGLFSKLGAFYEGLRIRHTLRNGQPVDVRLMGFLRPREIN